MPVTASTKIEERPSDQGLTGLAIALVLETGRTARALLGMAADTGRQVTASAGSVPGRLAGPLLQRASDQVELRMTRLLNAFQIPTHRDVRELNERVERLSRAVDRLAAAPRRGRAGSGQRATQSRIRAR